MMPPQADSTGQNAMGKEPAAASLRLGTLKKRSEFLNTARGPRVVMPGFILQMRHRDPIENADVRAGYTCSKKVGNAVARNRAKRRLREIARLTLPHCGLPQTDYVLVGRAKHTEERAFDLLVSELRDALIKIHTVRK